MIIETYAKLTLIVRIAAAARGVVVGGARANPSLQVRHG
jgi:hypothetical protein